MWSKALPWITALAVITPLLWERRVAIQLLYTNQPGKVPLQHLFKSYSIDHKSIVRNCEDLALNEDLGILYLSCNPGRDRWNTPMGILISSSWKPGAIYYLDYMDPQAQPVPLPIDNWSTNPRSAETLHPLGIAVDVENSRLYMTSHSEPHPAIEILHLSSDGKSASWNQTLSDHEMHAPNSILPISSTEILFTNDHYFTAIKHGFLASLETYLALPGGSLVHYDLVKGKATTLTNIPFANGVARLNSTHIAVASTMLPAIFIYSFNATSLTVQETAKIRTTFWPDNLSVDGHGRLLVAGHSWALGVAEVAKSRHKYDLDETGEKGLLPLEEAPRTGSWVAEWDGHVLRELYTGETEFGTSTTAVRDVKRKVGFVGGLYERGVLAWKE